MSVLSGGLLVKDAKKVNSTKTTILGYLVLKKCKKVTSPNLVAIAYKKAVV